MGNAPTVLVVQTLLTTEFSSKPGRAFSIASTNRAPFLIPYELIFLVYIPGDPAGSLMTSLRQARSGWCLMRARAWVGWPGSLTSPNRRFATGSVRPGPIGRRVAGAALSLPLWTSYPPFRKCPRNRIKPMRIATHPRGKGTHGTRRRHGRARYVAEHATSTGPGPQPSSSPHASSQGSAARTHPGAPGCA